MNFCAFSWSFSNFCVIVSDILRTGVEQYSIVSNSRALYTKFAANTDIELLTHARRFIQAKEILSTLCKWSRMFSNGSKCIPRYLYLDVKLIRGPCDDTFKLSWEQSHLSAMNSKLSIFTFFRLMINLFLSSQSLMTVMLTDVFKRP